EVRLEAIPTIHPVAIRDPNRAFHRRRPDGEGLSGRLPPGRNPVNNRIRLERELSYGDELAVVNAPIDLDVSQRGKENARSPGLSARLNLLTGSGEVEQ